MRPHLIYLAVRAGMNIEARDKHMAEARKETVPALRSVYVGCAKWCSKSAAWYLAEARRQLKQLEIDNYGLRANLEDMEREIQELRR